MTTSNSIPQTTPAMCTHTIRHTVANTVTADFLGGTSENATGHSLASEITAKPANDAAMGVVSGDKAVHPEADRVVTDASLNGSSLGMANGNALTDAERKHLLDDIETALQLAITDNQTRLLSSFHQVVVNGWSLPSKRGRPHMFKILQAAGLNRKDRDFDPNVRKAYSDFVGRMPLDLRVEKPGEGEARTLVEKVSAKLESMEANGVPFPRYAEGSPRISLQGTEQLMGLSPGSICRHANIMVMVRKWIPRLGIGEVFRSNQPLTRRERAEWRTKLIDDAQSIVASGLLLPASADRDDRIDFDHLTARIGAPTTMQRDCVYRKELARIRRVYGVQPRIKVRRRGVLYGEVLTALADHRRALYRMDHPAAEGGDGEAKAGDNDKSSLRRFMAHLERDLDDVVGADFEEGYQDAIAECEPEGRSAANFRASMSRARMVARALVAREGLPDTLHEALAKLVQRRFPTTMIEIARQADVPVHLLRGWRNGECVPNVHSAHHLASLEREFGLPDTALTGLLDNIPNGRIGASRLKEVVLSDGRKLKTKGLWKYLPSDALTWDEDRLAPAMERVQNEIFSPQSIFAIGSVASRTTHRLPPEDVSTPFRKHEWPDYVMLQKSIMHDGRLRRPGTGGADSTLEMQSAMLSMFSRWLMLDPARGGLGLAAHQVTLMLLLNPMIAVAYCCWRMTRFADLIVDGVPRGVVISSTEAAFLDFVRGLVDPDYGWLTQAQGRFPLPEPMNQPMPTVAIMTGKDVMNVDMPIGETPVMPAELLAKAGNDWSASCDAARRVYRVYGAHIRATYKLVRDPHDSVRPILEHPQPLAVVLRMIEEAKRHVPHLVGSGQRHATAHAKILIMLLLCTVCFRQYTLRGLKWVVDGTGGIRLVEGELEIKVSAEDFKNMRNTDLFGPSWRRRDYHRFVQNWGGIVEQFQYYVRVCRPILLDGRKSDLLFPPTRMHRDDAEVPMDAGIFHQIVRSFTREFCVYNASRGSGLPGVKPFGPHVMRDIVATHIIKNLDSPNPYAVAADVIGTGETQVRKRYGWIDMPSRLGKADDVFNLADRTQRGPGAIW